MVNLDDTVKRLLSTKGLTQGKEAAKILGISPADLSNRKKRGTLLPLLIEWAIKERVNLHWFLTGEQPAKPHDVFTLNPLLTNVNEWLNDEKKHEDAEFCTLFRQQMVRAFFDYERWIQMREESIQEPAEVKKRANGGGWK
jgi:hypothetical protein